MPSLRVGTKSSPLSASPIEVGDADANFLPHPFPSVLLMQAFPFLGRNVWATQIFLKGSVNAHPI